METSFAYLADGKLFFKEPGKDIRLVESAFIQQMLERQQKTRDRHDWKSQGMGWNLTRGMNPAAAEQMGVRNVRTCAIASGAEGSDLLYVINTGTVGGLFAWSKADNSERRMLHRNGFSARDLARHPVTHKLALTMSADDGSSHIGVMDFSGRGVREVTEGDSLDESPSWAAGQEGVLLYQSAGIGRNSAGFISARGSYAVIRLDLTSGDMQTLVEDDAFDYLLPRQSAEGTLYYIRRPYTPIGHGPVSMLTMAKDALLFPVRLILTFVHFFNWFSMVFRRKPLLTASGPPKEAPDSRYMMLWGMMIDAEKAMQSKDGTKSLVPKTWKLMKRTVDGTASELASGVLSYDLSSDGSVLFTDGVSISRSVGGKIESVGNGKMIERIVSI